MDKISPAKLFEVRKAKGKTQGDLAKALTIDQSAYSRKEKNGDFTDKEIDKIVTVLKISKVDIIGEDVALIDLYKIRYRQIPVCNETYRLR